MKPTKIKRNQKLNLEAYSAGYRDYDDMLKNEQVNPMRALSIVMSAIITMVVVCGLIVLYQVLEWLLPGLIERFSVYGVYLLKVGALCLVMAGVAVVVRVVGRG